MTRRPPPELAGLTESDFTARLKRTGFAVLALTCLALFLLISLWNLFFHYVEEGQMLIVISKTGSDLPVGELLAGPGQKGPQKQVLGEGRHFVLPFFYAVETQQLSRLNMEIPAEQVGIVTARVGADLPAGQILAAPGQKGIQRQVLPPGRHRLNPYGYTVELKPATRIQPGYVGFVTSLVGAPPSRYHVTLSPAAAGEAARAAAVADALAKVSGVGEVDRGRLETGVLIVACPGPDAGPRLGGVTGVHAVRGPFAGPGEKGIQIDVLQPGLYYVNPYELNVREVEVGMNQVSFLGADQIAFPSADAFDIRLDSTVEWELHPQNVALVMAEFGARQEIEDKVLVAQSRSIGRLEGSKYGAKEFLLGEGRSQIQEAFTSRLLEKCREKHVTIHSAYIRHISIPDNLLQPIRESYVAQEIERTAKVQEETRRSAAALQREQALITQRKQEVHAETEALKLRLQAEATREVAEIEATTRRLVAEKQQEIAQLEAQRTKRLGEAQADVQRLLGEARAGLFKLKVAAFKGDGDAFARYTLAESVGEDLSIRLVETGEGTLWTDLDKSTGLGAPLLDAARKAGEAPARR